jgi:hypothetical protein
MEILAIWLFFGLLGAYFGQKKGINTGLAFVAGILLGPLSFLMLFVSSEGKKCPQCAEMVKKDAVICKHCQHKFETDRSTVTV